MKAQEPCLFSRVTRKIKKEREKEGGKTIGRGGGRERGRKGNKSDMAALAIFESSYLTAT